jgi:hypothetical protein
MTVFPEGNAQEHLHETEEVTEESVGLFGFGTLVVALGLLALVPFATHGQPAGKAWFLSPRNLPIAGLALMILGGGLLTAQFFRSLQTAEDRGAFWARARAGYTGMGEALQYCAIFCGYVVLLGYIGFFFSTLIFGQACLWRAGMRARRWAVSNLVFVLVVELVLRVAMGLWFPQAPVLQFTPDWLANSIGPYL